MRTSQTIPTSLVPPQNLEAEICTLGAMLLSEKACEEVFSILSAEDFYSPRHRKIFNAMKQLVLKGMAVDLVTLKNELKADSFLDEPESIDYLVHIAESVPSAANATYYALIVQDKAIERKLDEAGSKIIQLARDSYKDPQEKLDQSEQLIFEVGSHKLGKYFTHVKTIADSVFEEVDTLYEAGQPMLGTPSGYYDLDKMTGGLYPGELTIIAARPSMGKTALVLNIALNIAQHKKGNIAVFSLEMSGKQLVKRIISMSSGVGMNVLKRTNLPKSDYDKLADSCNHLDGIPLYIDDVSDISPLEMRGKCRRLKQDGGLSLIVVDYLQLMRGSRRSENRVQEISDIARSLKSIAKEMEVPVLALSQLNRSVEAREDKRPMLSDLRESGSIEAEADLVIFIYRDAYYKAKEVSEEVQYNPDRVEEAELIIAKHRNGPTGKVITGFHPSCVRFVNLVRHVEPE